MYKMSAPQLPEVLDSDESDEELPENVILGSEFDFDINANNPSTHLFFDDHPYNIIPVQDMANVKVLNLKSVWCLPTLMTLYGIEGGPQFFDCANQEKKDAYYKLKLTDAASFVRDVPRSTPRKIGTGITREIIQKIISKEREQTRQGVYFFDFDMLLSQFNELAFPEIDDLPTPDWFEQYAKYLFSDYIGVEPLEGRLNLLKSMFGAIGPARIYIITANGTANDTNPKRMNFIKLIKVLLPTFIPDHLRFGRQKSDVIADILKSESRPNGGARSTTRKTMSKARKTMSKARKTMSKARKTRSNARRTRSNANASRRSRCSRKQSRTTMTFVHN
jgi:hypothetical protein